MIGGVVGCGGNNNNNSVWKHPHIASHPAATLGHSTSPFPSLLNELYKEQWSRT
jgi:hypothetical protein